MAVGKLVPARRRRAARTVAAAAVLLALAPATHALGDPLHGGVVDPAGAARLQARDRWQQIAETLDAAADAADPVYVAADAASVLARTVARTGWLDPQVPALVDALLATANPDGGFGLATPWDAYQDGTVNPATTSYGATTAGHVGPVLLDGYAAGAVPAEAVARAMDSLLDLPRTRRCLPYSNSAFDRGRPCVWNVYFGVADWVLRAARLTRHRMGDALVLAAEARSTADAAPQNPVSGYWPYTSRGGAPQDLGHQLWTARAVDGLRGTSDALALTLSRPLWRRQAEVFHDASAAAALGGLAVLDCRYATDATVLRYAGSTGRGAPYALRSMAAQARTVLARCFPAAGARAVAAPAALPVPLG